MNAKRIRLTRGKFARVDNEIYDQLSKFTWHARKEGYGWYAGRSANIDGKQITIRMHREIMGLTSGDSLIVDHKNGDGLDNQRHNLRVATKSQNNQNRAKHKKLTSKYKGVTFDKYWGKWKSQIRVTLNGQSKILNLGFFKTEVEAAHKYDAAAMQYFGKFARTNYLTLVA